MFEPFYNTSTFGRLASARVNGVDVEFVVEHIVIASDLVAGLDRPNCRLVVMEQTRGP